MSMNTEELVLGYQGVLGQNLLGPTKLNATKKVELHPKPGSKSEWRYNKQIFTESLPILELIEECFPDRPILPKSPIKRHRVRVICETINGGMQPFQNRSIW